MTPDKELFPGFNDQLETAVRAAVTNALADIDTVNLKLCQDKLTELTTRLGNAEARAVLHEELSSRRKVELDGVKAEMVELKARLAFMQSTIDNLKAAADE